MLEVATRLGRYELLGPLGSGGMGDVYRARDEVLGREVALKVLPEALALDESRRARFEREARALARLSHPNILEIYDFGSDGSVTYAVTELLEGETLRRRIERAALPWQEAVAISASVAAGLAAAHGEGIVHRDLKPENVFLVSDGRVKILDFGIAQVTDPPEEPAPPGPIASGPLTAPGLVMGTVGYVSPEQVRGRPVDRRSDIFSLGCVGWEMVTGRGAFARDTDAETLRAILKDDPPEPAVSEASVPVEVTRILRRCLEKEPERRYQSADELVVDLGAVTAEVRGSARLVPRRRQIPIVVAMAVLAVLAALSLTWWMWYSALDVLDPRAVVVAEFENRTGDDSLDPLGLVAADWITQGLEQTGTIHVVPTSTALPALRAGIGEGVEEGDSDPVLVLAATTGAGIVVSGTYQIDGEALVFHSRVVDGSSGNLIRAVEPVRGVRDDPMQAIGDLGDRVLGAVVWHLHPGIPVEYSDRPPRFEAYLAYAAGLEQFHVDYEQSIGHFARACELDPDFLAPKLWLASAYWNFGFFTGRTEAYAASERVVEQLEEQRERLSPVGRLMVRWLRARTEGRDAEAYRLLREARELAPTDIRLASLLAKWAREVNRPREALDVMLEAEPYYIDRLEMGVYWFHVRSTIHHLLGEYEEELEVARRGQESYPHHLWMSRAEVRALGAMGRLDEIHRVIDGVMSLPARFDDVGAVMKVAALELRAHGWLPESLDVAARWLEWESDGGDLAFALQLTGRLEEAHDMFAELATDRPGDPWLLSRLGTTAAALGDEAEARRVDAELAALDLPYLFGIHTYYRAHIASLLGEHRRAVELLRQAIAEGLGHKVWIHRAVELEPLRDDPAYREFMRPKR